MWTAILHALTAIAAVFVGIHLGWAAGNSPAPLVTLSGGAPLAVAVLLPLYVLARSISIVEANDAASRAYKLNKVLVDEVRALRADLAERAAVVIEDVDEAA